MSSIPIPFEAEVHILEKDGSRRRVRASWTHEKSRGKPKVWYPFAPHGASGPEPGPKRVWFDEAASVDWDKLRQGLDGAFLHGEDPELWEKRKRRAQMMQEQFNASWQEIVAAERRRR